MPASSSLSLLHRFRLSPLSLSPFAPEGRWHQGTGADRAAGLAWGWEDRLRYVHDGRTDGMAQRTKADRQAAAKKGAATRQRKAAEKSGADAKSVGMAALSTAKSLGEAVKQGTEAVSSRVGASRKDR